MVLGIGLALAFGLRPWQEIELSWLALAIGLVATLPPVAVLMALPAGRWRWADELVALVRRFLTWLFRNARPGAAVLLSILAGIGEELLFRGVIQAGLTSLWTPATGIVLAALLFGAAHAVSLSYLLLASLMGLYLGVLYHWTGNLLIPILVHALYDWFAIRFYLRQRRDSNRLT